MNITSARYTSSEKDVIEAVIDGVSLDVPTDDTGNRHYAEIQKQVAAGELTIADAD
jgi:hypothetical protein|tara:strand:+ start:1762 stop:1929 length:168 start_codon:yes stop_codon:yes gene_type:complete